MIPWWEWPSDFKQKNVDFLKSWVMKNKEAIKVKKLIQWHLDKQWKVIRNFAKSKGIKLIGDLPFYVSRDSVEVWSNKSLFSVSQNGDLIFQSGVPPDYFSSTDNYGVLQLIFGLNIKGQISIGGKKDLKDNSNLLTF